MVRLVGVAFRVTRLEWVGQGLEEPRGKESYRENTR